VGERRVHVAVVEGAIGDAGGALRGGNGIENGIEGLVLHLEQLERILGEVTVPCDDDCDRFARVPGDVVRSGEVGDGGVDSCGERSRQCGDVGAGQHPEHSGLLEGARRIQPHDPCMRERGTEHGRVTGASHRVEIVDEASLAAKESLVLETGKGAPDPRRRLDRHPHRTDLTLGSVAGLREDLRALLEAVRRGDVTADEALEQVASLPYRDLGFARVDVHRELRQGAPEAVLAEGKAPEQVASIVTAMLEAGAGSVLVTRADENARKAVFAVAPDAEEDLVARAVWVARGVPEPRGLVVMVSGGTSDGPVLREARLRAELLGTTVVVHEDVGVAGLHRLAPVLPDVERADCVVVVAGMDAALASVVGGVAAAPVIGVPTSVGYGSARGGETALNAMLCSCAAGVAVVGIDDGLGAGTIAARIARGREQ
jgi:NCAIR mutase (PurE)-related protein